MTAHRNLAVTSDRLGRAMQRLSSGFRINSAADDAAGLGISEKMRSQMRGLEQANRNIQDGISMLQTIDGALSEVHSILQRARELCVEWNNNVISWSDKLAIRDEMFALSDEIARIEQVTEFNGVKLLQSSTAAVTLQVGANSGEVVTVTLVDLFGPTVGNLVRPNTFFALPWVDADITGMDFHIDDVSAARARIGAAENRLEHTLNSNTTYLENLTGAESRIRDVDVAAEMTEFTKQQILQQTGTTALLFANHTPQRLLDLLPGADRGASGHNSGSGGWRV
jgi:flagellin